MSWPRERGSIPREPVANEVTWCYSYLGIEETYFPNVTVPVISDHIVALFCIGILAHTKHDPSKLVIDLEKVAEDKSRATFTHISRARLSITEGPGPPCETRIDEMFLDNATRNASVGGLRRLGTG